MTKKHKSTQSSEKTLHEHTYRQYFNILIHIPTSIKHAFLSIHGHLTLCKKKQKNKTKMNHD